MADYQGDEPSNDFIEFVQVWNRREQYPDAIILFESSSGGKSFALSTNNSNMNFTFGIHINFCHKITEFVVQVGYKIDEERTDNTRILTLVTSAGSLVEIKRKKKGNEPKGLPLCFTSTSVTIKWLNYPCSSHEGPVKRRYKLLDSSEHRIEATRTYLADT